MRCKSFAAAALSRIIHLLLEDSSNAVHACLAMQHRTIALNVTLSSLASSENFANLLLAIERYAAARPVA